MKKNEKKNTIQQQLSKNTDHRFTVSFYCLKYTDCVVDAHENEVLKKIPDAQQFFFVCLFEERKNDI